MRSHRVHTLPSTRSHRWELIKSWTLSLGQTISWPAKAIGPAAKIFNKMPIELLNGNERFVVFNISKIIPGGTVFAAKHSA